MVLMLEVVVMWMIGVDGGRVSAVRARGVNMGGAERYTNEQWRLRFRNQRRTFACYQIRPLP